MYDDVCDDCDFGSIDEAAPWCGEVTTCGPVYPNTELELAFVVDYLRSALLASRIDAALGAVAGLVADGETLSRVGHRLAQSLPFRGPCESAPEAT